MVIPQPKNVAEFSDHCFSVCSGIRPCICNTELVKPFSKSSSIRAFKRYCPSESMSEETTLTGEVLIHAIQANKDGVWSFLEYCLPALLTFHTFVCMAKSRKSTPNPFINYSKLEKLLFVTICRAQLYHVYILALTCSPRETGR